MSNTIAKAQMQDALSVEYGKILLNGKQRGYVTGLTIDGKSPEDLINCISGTLRRRKPSYVEWSSDAVVLYNNIKDLYALKKDGALFQIVISLENPDKSNPDNLGQVITIQDCRIQDHSISLNDSSVFKMSGRASDWEVREITA